MALTSGTLCILWQKSDSVPIRARKAPVSVSNPRTQKVEDIVICNIPAGTRVLYMSSQADSFNNALRKKGTGPYGFTPAQLLHHLILWGDRPVWVSSGDCELKPC